MSGSPIALKILRQATAAVTVAAIAWWFYLGMRWNDLFTSAKRMPLGYCQQHSADFQTVEMKATVCVPRETALRWEQNERLMMVAMAVLAACFLTGFVVQRFGGEEEARAEGPESRVASIGVVICTVLLLFWGVWPAVAGVTLLAATLVGMRLWIRLSKARSN